MLANEYYEPRLCCFDSGGSLTGFVLELVSLISLASVVQTHMLNLHLLIMISVICVTLMVVIDHG